VAGPTGTRTATAEASDGSIGHLVALKPAPSGPLVVNSTGETSDLLLGNGICDTGGTNSEGDPECTLNAAIQEANALAGSDDIHFNIPDSDPGYRNLGAGLSYWRIQPSAAITPLLTDGINVDATTQTSYAVAQGFFVNDTGPEIEINGTGGAGGNGLEIQSSNNEIRGFAINRFVTGIAVLGGDANVIVGNYLGPDASGASGLVGNTDEGVRVYGATNTVIGGTADADRNVISGNRLRGVAIDDWSDGAPIISNGTQVIGNYIGTNAAGTAALPFNGTPAYQQIGIYLLDSPNGVIGTATDGNVISGNEWYGIYFWGTNATGNAIQGNIIGLDATATNPVPNATEAGGGRAGDLTQQRSRQPGGWHRGRRGQHRRKQRRIRRHRERGFCGRQCDSGEQDLRQRRNRDRS
jgi:hypothetical protein